MKKLLLGTALVALALPLAAEEGQFPGVKGLMTAQEYEDAGLNQLSPEQLKALDQWLIRYTAWEAPAIRQSVQEVKEIERDHEVTANIKPPFEGWDGKTYFYLDNGQVWQQRTTGKLRYSGDDTAVVISKNLLGFYVMEHVATGREVGVKRVK